MTITNQLYPSCQVRDSFQLIIYPLPESQLPADTTVCDNFATTLSVGPWQNVHWVPESLVSCYFCPTTGIAVADTLDLYVYMENQFGCGIWDTIRINAEDPPFVKAHPPLVEMCTPDSITLHVQGYGAQFQWYDQNWQPIATDTPLSVWITDTTVFYITALPHKACPIDTDTITVYSYPYPQVDLPSDTILLEGLPLTIAAYTEHVANFYWYPVGLIPEPHRLVQSLNFTESVWIYFMGENLIGCQDVDSMYVQVIKRPPCNDSTIYIPNAFTPNGDGINDVWRVYSVAPDVTVKEARVYDKWGRLLWHMENVGMNPETGASIAGWDGTFQGRKLRPDVYVYVVTVQCLDRAKGEIWEVRFKGDVSLLR